MTFVLQLHVWLVEHTASIKTLKQLFPKWGPGTSGGCMRLSQGVSQQNKQSSVSQLLQAFEVWSVSSAHKLPSSATNQPTKFSEVNHQTKTTREGGPGPKALSPWKSLTRLRVEIWYMTWFTVWAAIGEKNSHINLLAGKNSLINTIRCTWNLEFTSILCICT